MDLQTAFYTLGIIFMSIMLLILIGLTIAVFIIKAKIDAIHRQIEEKLAMVTNIASIGSDVIGKAKKAVSRS